MSPKPVSLTYVNLIQVGRTWFILAYVRLMWCSPT